MPPPELTATGKENGTLDGTKDAASRKRRKAQNTSSATAGANPPLDEEAEYWKQQYFALKNLRETNPEEQYRILEGRSKDREQKLTAYVLRIEKDLAAANAELKAVKAKAVAVAEAKSEPVTSDAHANAQFGGGDGENPKAMAAKMEYLERVIRRYGMLTAVSLSNIQPESFDVLIQNAKKGITASFRLTAVRAEPTMNRDAAGGDGTSSEGANRVTTFLRLDPLDGKEHLPAYMRNAIEFEDDQCPTLIHEVLAQIFPGED